MCCGKWFTTVSANGVMKGSLARKKGIDKRMFIVYYI
jgi:hypothetical protein